MSTANAFTNNLRTKFIIEQRTEIQFVYWSDFPSLCKFPTDVRTLPSIRGPLHSIRRTLPTTRGTLHSIRRTLPTIRGPLHSIRRPLHSIRRPLHSIRRPLHSIRRTLH